MTVPKVLPTLARVNELLSYDPLSGEFRWRVSRGGWIQAGQVAGGIEPNGYWTIKIDGRSCKAHRLAWLITSGDWPPVQVDHRNGRRDDNRIINLRLATFTENASNRARRRDNSSGYPGVYYDSQHQKWCAQIKRRRLGLFVTIEEAIVIRQAAEDQYFKEFRKVIQP